MKRKANKAARKLPPDYPELKMAFLKRIDDEVKTNDIQLDLLINWDQTGSKLVPVNSWTMVEEGCSSPQEPMPVNNVNAMRKHNRLSEVAQCKTVCVGLCTPNVVAAFWS